MNFTRSFQISLMALPFLGCDRQPSTSPKFSSKPIPPIKSAYDIIVEQLADKSFEDKMKFYSPEAISIPHYGTKRRTPLQMLIDALIEHGEINVMDRLEQEAEEKNRSVYWFSVEQVACSSPAWVPLLRRFFTRRGNMTDLRKLRAFAKLEETWQPLLSGALDQSNDRELRYHLANSLICNAPDAVVEKLKPLLNEHVNFFLVSSPPEGLWFDEEIEKCFEWRSAMKDEGLISEPESSH